MLPPPTSSVFCPACGQALALPLHDLTARFPCPRCQIWHVVGDFADRNQPIVVSPIGSTPPNALASPSPAVWSPAFASPTVSPLPQGSAIASAPPPGSAVRSVPDALISGGLQFAGAGLAAARQSTSWLLNVADRVDASLGGRRALVLGIAAIAGVVVQLFGARAERDLWGVVAGAVFLLALAVVALAFVARCRDDSTGRFSMEVLRERVATFFATLDEVATDFREASLEVRLQLVGRTIVVVGVIVAEALILTLRYDVVEFDPGVIVAVLWLASLGAIAWVWGRHAEGVAGGSAAFQSTPPDGASERGLGVLPSVVSSAERVPLSGNPAVDGLLEHLCAWRPGWLASESEYQERLFRGLRRKRRDLNVQKEVWVETEHGAKRRIDLMLETRAGRVAVELKSKYGAGACQRAIGQVEEYTETGVEAVVLVLCAPQTDTPSVQSLLDKVSKMRERGMPVVAVLAMADGARGRLASPNTMLAMQQATSPTSALSWKPPAFAAAFATLVAASSWAHPPRGLLALEAPVTRSTAALSSASMTGGPSGTPSGSCTATASSSFHLRPTATMASIGPEYAAGTQLVVFEFTGLARRASKLYRVQTLDGSTGYAFIAPNELSGNCAQ